MWYRDGVTQKIKERSWKYDGVPGTYIDIVNAINATSVHWAADRLVRFPLLQFIFASKSDCQVFFSAVFHLRPKRTPLDCTQSKRSTICSQFWWVSGLTYWHDGIADLWYLSSSTTTLLTSFRWSKSDVCILLGWSSLALAITNMAFHCAGQPHKLVVLFKPWLPKVSWKSGLKVHLYV